MWTHVVAATSWSLAWLSLVSVGFFLLKPRGRTARLIRFPLWAILLVALCVRLLPALILPVGAGYDIDSFWRVGEAVVAGQDVYTSAAQNRHPYLPFQMYVIGFSYSVAQSAALPFVIPLKLPLILADVAITAAIYDSVRRRTPASDDQAAYYAWLYALNPIAILVSAYHGQFDAIPLLLILWSWMLWRFGRRPYASAAGLGLAVLNKTWPLVMLPVLLLRLSTLRTRLTYAVIVLVIPFLAVVVYLWAYAAEPLPMLGRALTHTGVPGYWGYSALLAVAGRSSPPLEALHQIIYGLRRWLLLAAGLLALWVTRKQTVPQALTLIILSEFAISVGMGIQWLLWVIPFAILARDVWWLKRYTLAGMIFLVGQLYGLHMYPWASTLFEPATADIVIRLISVPAWLVTLLWAGSRLWQLLVLEQTSFDG